MTSTPLAAPFKVLLEDQQPIAGKEFQHRLFSVDFFDALSPKVVIFSEIAKIDDAANYKDTNC